MLAHLHQPNKNKKMEKKMKMYKFQKRFITLIEMMIVMFLIAMITGVIAVNYTGSLEEGKAFKTKNGIEKINTVVDLYLASNPGAEVNVPEIVHGSPLVKNSKELLKDGWGQDYTFDTDTQGNVKVVSTKYNEYLSKSKNSMFKKDAK